MKKLDSKAIKAGVFLLMNAVLWFVQVCADYLIKDGGFWGIGGLFQNLFTVELANPMSIFFLLAMFIAAFTLLSRNRTAAVVGLIILAAYYVFSMSPWDSFTLAFDVIALVLAIVFTAVAVAASDGEGEAIPMIATILIAVFVVLHVVTRLMNGGYGSGFAGLPVTFIYGLRYFLLAMALFFAAHVRSEKKSAHAA